MGSVHEVIEAFRKAPSNSERGTKFEQLMVRYFELDPMLSQQYEKVWRWIDWPGRRGKPDTGIDLVARERDTGDYTAIQCKFYEPTHTLAKGDIDSFFTASGKTPFSTAVPTELTKRSWIYVLRATARQFSRDQCTDLAAALTYYSVLSLFPAVLAVVSLLGVFGQGQSTVDAVLQIVSDLGPSSAVETLKEPVQQHVEAPAAGFALIAGIAGALWSASGYLVAFGRALNRMYEVEEGRPVWKLRPTMLLVTVTALALIGCAAVMLAVSGPVARAIGDASGAGDTALTVWNIARWPVVLVFVVLAVAILYYAPPNIQQPKFRWISGGAALAIVVWILASVIFGFYVANFSSYNKTYGSLAGAIVFLLWLWITNLALLFGAELDSELERGRELRQAHNFEGHAEGSDGVCTDVDTPKRKEMPIGGPTHAMGNTKHIVTAASLGAAAVAVIIAAGKRPERRGGR